PAPGDSYEAVARLVEEMHTEVEVGDTVGVLARKERALEDAPRDGSATNWSGWAVLPDLVVIDGGKGQLSAAQEIMREVGLLDVPMIGLAKREEEVFLPGRSDPVIL